jgi:hypothetical protein
MKTNKMENKTGFHSPKAIEKRRLKKLENEIKLLRKEIDELKERGYPFSNFSDKRLLEILKECEL